jgi:hypothetical protein
MIVADCHAKADLPVGTTFRLPLTGCKHSAQNAIIAKSLNSEILYMHLRKWQDWQVGK